MTTTSAMTRTRTKNEDDYGDDESIDIEDDNDGITAGEFVPNVSISQIECPLCPATLKAVSGKSLKLSDRELSGRESYAP